MTTAQEARSSRRKRSLRHRMIVSLTGLAVLPLLAALAALFFVVRDDVGGIRGSQLAQEARQLTENLRGELHRIQQIAAGLAASPAVKASLEGSGPFPEKLFSSTRNALPGILRIDLAPGGRPAEPGQVPSFA